MGEIGKHSPSSDKEKACISKEENSGGVKRMITPEAKKKEWKDHDRPARSDEPRNYSNPDPLNCGLEGKSVTVTLVNGRIESGKLVKAGQYFIELIGSNGRTLIVAKSAIVTVSVL